MNDHAFQKYKEIADASILAWLDYDLWTWMGSNLFDTQSLEKNDLVFDRINLLQREYEKLYSLHISNLTEGALSNLDCAIVELALDKCRITLGLDFSRVNLETFEAYEYKLYVIENEFMNKCENFLKSDNPIVADIFIAKKFSNWFNQNTDLILVPENVSEDDIEKSLDELIKLSHECLEILDPILQSLKFADYMKNQFKQDGLNINKKEVTNYLNLYFNFWSVHFLSYKDMFHSIIDSSKQKDKLDAWEHLGTFEEIFNRMFVIGIELSKILLSVINQEPLKFKILSVNSDMMNDYLKLKNYKTL